MDSFYLIGETDEEVIKAIKWREGIVSSILTLEQMESRLRLAKSRIKKVVQLKIF